MREIIDHNDQVLQTPYMQRVMFVTEEYKRSHDADHQTCLNDVNTVIT